MFCDEAELDVCSLNLDLIPLSDEAEFTNFLSKYLDTSPLNEPISSGPGQNYGVPLKREVEINSGALEDVSASNDALLNRSSSTQSKESLSGSQHKKSKLPKL